MPEEKAQEVDAIGELDGPAVIDVRRVLAGNTSGPAKEKELKDPDRVGDFQAQASVHIAAKEPLSGPSWVGQQDPEGTSAQKPSSLAHGSSPLAHHWMIRV